LRPPIASLFDFADFRAAMATAASGESLGKVAVRIA